MLFGEKVKQLRKEKKLTQTELAEAIGVTLRTVQNYETKNLFPKNQNVVNKLCKVLETSSDYLISDDEFVNRTHENEETSDMLSAEEIINQANVFFFGGEIPEEDRDNVMRAIQEAYWRSKQKNKEKYTPKKRRKDEE